MGRILASALAFLCRIPAVQPTVPVSLHRLLLILPAVSLAWLCLYAPAMFWREAYFTLLILSLTLATRTVTWNVVLTALMLGIGVAAPLTVLVGVGLKAAGLDPTEGVGSWGVVPVVEEVVKLLPVWVVALRYSRRTGLTLNPSDYLMIGVAAGAGFAMVENAELVRHSPGVVRDMASQYGPTWLVPGAWGAAGYVGHAAATGMAAAGIGMWRSVSRV
ncbi:MAG: PrsW family intramembrane metalloprotease, partial [Acidobacteria bacterium]|nr:PrsW family intramembrane metalloprotease [Acidobacteriota bacterium]